MVLPNISSLTIAIWIITAFLSAFAGIVCYAFDTRGTVVILFKLLLDSRDLLWYNNHRQGDTIAKTAYSHSIEHHFTIT